MSQEIETCPICSNELVACVCMTVDDPKYFDKIETSMGVVYRTKKYTGPVAINAIPSEDLKEYHRKSKVQFNIPQGFDASP